MIKKFYPHYFHRFGLNGDLVFYCYGKYDLKQLQSSTNVDELLEYFIFLSEYMWNHIAKREDQKLITIIDISQAQISDLTADTVDFLRKSSKIIQSYYTERSRVILLINAPFYFGFIWRMVSTFMEEDTKKKIFVLGPNYLEKISKYIHFQSIPIELGGSGETLGQSPEELSFLDYVKSCNGNDESIAEKIIRKFT